MAKLAFPNPLSAAYRQIVSIARRRLQDIANLGQTAGANAALAAQVQPLMANLGGRVIVSGQQVVCPAPTGTRITGYTFTVVNGVITAAVGY